MKQRILTLKILRQDPARDITPHFETYKIPYTEKMFVLDALLYVRENYDHSLAFRYNCRHRHCGSCVVVINGRPALACTTLVGKNIKMLTVEPLPHFPVIRDLVVELEAYNKRLQRLRLGLFRLKTPEQEPEIIPQISFLKYKEFSKCMECYICMTVCPIFNINPGKFVGPLGFVKLAKRICDPRDEEERIRIAVSEGIYYCSTCANCYELCPKEIPLPLIGIEHARNIISKSGLGPLPSQIKFGKHTIEEHNPYLEPHKERLEWLDKSVDLPEQAEIVYFVGCTSSYRQKNIALATFEIFKKAGLDFTILRDEWCCGSPLLRTGQWDYVKGMAKHNIEAIEKAGATMVCTSCAGCYRTWKIDYLKDYKDLLGVDHKFKILHTSELLERIIKEGKLILDSFERKVTYHDPCHLGRHGKIYEPPRNILKNIKDLKLLEMMRNRDNALCCGAGGGLKAGYPEVSLETAHEVVKTAESLRAQALVTTCPFCYRNFKDTIKEHQSKLELYDLVEIVNNIAKQRKY